MTNKMLFSKHTYLNYSEYVQNKKYMCAPICFTPPIKCYSENCHTTVLHLPQETCHVPRKRCTNIIHTHDHDCQEGREVNSMHQMRCSKCRKTYPFFSDCQ